MHSWETCVTIVLGISCFNFAFKDDLLLYINSTLFHIKPDQDNQKCMVVKLAPRCYNVLSPWYITSGKLRQNNTLTNFYNNFLLQNKLSDKTSEKLYFKIEVIPP